VSATRAGRGHRSLLGATFRDHAELYASLPSVIRRGKRTPFDIDGYGSMRGTPEASASKLRELLSSVYQTLWVRLFPPMGGDASSNPGCSAEAAPRPGAPRPLVGPVGSAQEQGSVSTRATSAHLSNFAAVLRAVVTFGLRLT